MLGEKQLFFSFSKKSSNMSHDLGHPRSIFAGVNELKDSLKEISGAENGERYGLLNIQNDLAGLKTNLDDIKNNGEIMSLQKLELLAPAGNFEKMKTAIYYGSGARRT